MIARRLARTGRNASQQRARPRRVAVVAVVCHTTDLRIAILLAVSQEKRTLAPEGQDRSVGLLTLHIRLAFPRFLLVPGGGVEAVRQNRVVLTAPETSVRPASKGLIYRA